MRTDSFISGKNNAEVRSLVAKRHRDDMIDFDQLSASNSEAPPSISSDDGMGSDDEEFSEGNYMSDDPDDKSSVSRDDGAVAAGFDDFESDDDSDRISLASSASSVQRTPIVLHSHGSSTPDNTTTTNQSGYKRSETARAPSLIPATVMARQPQPAAKAAAPLRALQPVAKQVVVVEHTPEPVIEDEDENEDENSEEEMEEEELTSTESYEATAALEQYVSSDDEETSQPDVSVEEKQPIAASSGESPIRARRRHHRPGVIARRKAKAAQKWAKVGQSMISVAEFVKQVKGILTTMRGTPYLGGERKISVWRVADAAIVAGSQICEDVIERIVQQASSVRKAKTLTYSDVRIAALACSQSFARGIRADIRATLLDGVKP